MQFPRTAGWANYIVSSLDNVHWDVLNSICVVKDMRFFKKDTVDKIKDQNSDQDFFSAIKICKKKRIGPMRTEDNRSLFYKKDISLLARNGFDFETSRKVMDIEKDEYLKIINLL